MKVNIENVKNVTGTEINVRNTLINVFESVETRNIKELKEVSEIIKTISDATKKEVEISEEYINRAKIIITTTPQLLNSVKYAALNLLEK